MDSIKEQKESLRKSVLLELKNLTTDQKTQESNILRKRLAEFISNNCPKDSLIATFAGLKIEPDLLGLHQLLPDYRLAYPRCGPDGSLHFHEINDPNTELLKGYYGIREPAADNDSLVSADDIALFIVPAIAYTESGLRLGKGGGYYDRILNGVSKQTKLVGVCYSLQLQDSLPVESHDIPVDQVIVAV